MLSLDIARNKSIYLTFLKIRNDIISKGEIMKTLLFAIIILTLGHCTFAATDYMGFNVGALGNMNSNNSQLDRLVAVSLTHDKNSDRYFSRITYYELPSRNLKTKQEWFDGIRLVNDMNTNRYTSIISLTVKNTRNNKDIFKINYSNGLQTRQFAHVFAASQHGFQCLKDLKDKKVRSLYFRTKFKPYITNQLKCIYY